jgi:hypothetical protein
MKLTSQLYFPSRLSISLHAVIPKHSGTVTFILPLILRNCCLAYSFAAWSHFVDTTFRSYFLIFNLKVYFDT